MPSFDIEQADVAPLMSSLIGVAVPVNNFGILPLTFLNYTHEYIAQAMVNNYLQLSAQFIHLRNEFSIGAFSKYLKDFQPLRQDTLEVIKRRMEHSLVAGSYSQTVGLRRGFKIFTSH